VSVVGTFCTLFEPLELRRVADEAVFALTVVLPKAQVYTYRFIVDGEPVPDPINPALRS